jgi:uncharacterized protein (TIGR02147 family)
MDDQTPAPQHPSDDPELLDYIDYRQYLRDKVKAIHAKNPKHSQRWLAKRAGFQSPHLLSMIISGTRTLTPKNAASLAEALKLPDREKDYFQTIVTLAHADSEEARKEVLRGIDICFKNGLFSDIPVAALDIFLEWYYGALSQIVILKDFKTDPAWSAEKLGISVEQAQEGIEFLLKAGFLEKQDGRLVRATPSAGNKYKTYPIQLTRYNLQMLEHAFRAFSFAREKRYFEGLTFGMSLHLMPELVHKIQRFFKELDMYVESNTDPKDEVFHVSLQLFPLTKY